MIRIPFILHGKIKKQSWVPWIDQYEEVSQFKISMIHCNVRHKLTYLQKEHKLTYLQKENN